MTHAAEVVYLDHAASTPLDPAVREAMLRVMTELPGNPSSVAHEPGRRAAAAVEQAREQVAAVIGSRPDELIWTSGATEANNLAIEGAARAWSRRTGRPGHMISVCTEHRAVLDPLRSLEARGWQITRLPVDSAGLISTDSLLAALGPDTALVSVMQVNNETGVIQDVAGVARALRQAEHGALLHVDAAQAAGRLPIDVRALDVDLLSLSGHKLYGPQGVGALFRRRQPLAPLAPLLTGGGQEGGLRAGTLATHQIVGFGVAVARAEARRADHWAELSAPMTALIDRLLTLPEVYLNGAQAPRVPHIASFSVGGVHPEALLAAVCGGDEPLAVSAGSACASAQGGSSHTLRAMGRTPALAAAALRVSPGRQTTVAMLERAADKMVGEIQRLRALAPARQAV
jgi:cysteine desulfurase